MVIALATGWFGSGQLKDIMRSRVQSSLAPDCLLRNALFQIGER